MLMLKVSIRKIRRLFHCRADIRTILTGQKALNQGPKARSNGGDKIILIRMKQGERFIKGQKGVIMGVPLTITVFIRKQVRFTIPTETALGTCPTIAGDLK